MKRMILALAATALATLALPSLAFDPYGIVDAGVATLGSGSTKVTGAMGAVGIGLAVNKWLSAEARVGTAGGSAMAEPRSVDCSTKYAKKTCTVGAEKASWQEDFGDVSAVARYAIAKSTELTGRVGAQYMDGDLHGLVGIGLHYTASKSIHLRAALEGSGELRTARAGITFNF